LSIAMLIFVVGTELAYFGSRKLLPADARGRRSIARQDVELPGLAARLSSYRELVHAEAFGQLGATLHRRVVSPVRRPVERRTAFLGEGLGLVPRRRAAARVEEEEVEVSVSVSAYPAMKHAIIALRLLCGCVAETSTRETGSAEV
jgi:hypothetical protein